MAETVQEDVAGHEVTLYIAEQDSRHVHNEHENGHFTYHQEDLVFGAWIDGEGANVTVTNFTRDSFYDDGQVYSDRTEEGWRVSLDGQAAGYTTDQRVTVQVFLVEVETEEVSVTSRFILIDHWGNTYGDGNQVRNDMGASVGQGELSSSYLNPNPTFGMIQFLNGGALTSQYVRIGDTSLRAGGGGGFDAYAGDWTGAFANAGAELWRCQGFQCQGDGVGFSECVVGVRPPFFVDCP